MQVRNKFILLGLFFVLITSYVSAQDTYIESMAKLREEQQESKKEIIAVVVSFNDAFKDTFRLIDDEFSRLIYSMVGLVGVVFSIMFLVYAKTTSRYKRDIQILMKAHSKHIDTLISVRLDEFVARLESRMIQETTTSLSKVEADFDNIVSDILPPDVVEQNVDQQVEIVVKEQVPKPVPVHKKRFEELKANVSAVEEPIIDDDGRVKVLNKPTSPLNRFKKRIRSGLRRVFGKGKETNDVKEFKK